MGKKRKNKIVKYCKAGRENFVGSWYLQATYLPLRRVTLKRFKLYPVEFVLNLYADINIKDWFDHSVNIGPKLPCKYNINRVWFWTCFPAKNKELLAATCHSDTFTSSSVFISSFALTDHLCVSLYKPDRLSPPLDIQLETVNCTAFSVRWKMPRRHVSTITGYKVQPRSSHDICDCFISIWMVRLNDTSNGLLKHMYSPSPPIFNILFMIFWRWDATVCIKVCLIPPAHLKNCWGSTARLETVKTIEKKRRKLHFKTRR